MPAIVYSLGTFEVNMDSNSGFTETGSCAHTNWLVKINVIIIKIPL
jgi:hypothetical protein